MCHETWNVTVPGEVRVEMRDGEKVNSDTLCQSALITKMCMYRKKEMGEAVLKNYNNRKNDLVDVIQLMKTRILELEQEKKDKNQ